MPIAYDISLTLVNSSIILVLTVYQITIAQIYGILLINYLEIKLAEPFPSKQCKLSFILLDLRLWIKHLDQLLR